MQAEKLNNNVYIDGYIIQFRYFSIEIDYVDWNYIHLMNHVPEAKFVDDTSPTTSKLYNIRQMTHICK